MTAYAIGSTQRVMSEPAQWALNRAADWLLDRQAKRRGDWAIRNPAIEPSGWYFEYANEFYPDTDDTAKVLLALEWASASDTQLQQEAETRALKWLVSMQSSDGGWAAFDMDNCARILTQVPFADHNAMLDPTCADITGRVLEALSGRNRNQDRGAIEKGVRYLLQSQQPDGSWDGRWGVNYLYGTCFGLRGLRAAGTDPSEASMICGAEWIRLIQNSDGAWGNPTYNTRGWKVPCYLITDAHWNSFEDLMSQTPWQQYGRGQDERCEHCMVHCGFEPSAALGVNAQLGDSLRMLQWALS